MRRRLFEGENPRVATGLNNLAIVRAARGDAAEAFSLLQQAQVVEAQLLVQVLGTSSERVRLAFAQSLRPSVDVFLSLVLQHFPSSPRHVRAALDLVLRRKGLLAETVHAQREALLSGRHPALATQLEELRALRARIADDTLRGPGAEGHEEHGRRLRGAIDSRERLEAELASAIPEMALDRRLREVDTEAVARALPVGIALVEWVRAGHFDFEAVPARGESGWRGFRYLAFVVRAGAAGAVELVDLGEAEEIERLIALYGALVAQRAETARATETSGRSWVFEREALGRVLRGRVFDPVAKHMEGVRRLFVVPDGALSFFPLDVLPAEENGWLIDGWHLTHLTSGRDLVRMARSEGGAWSSSPSVGAGPDFDLAFASLPESGSLAGASRERPSVWSRLAVWTRRPSALGPSEAVTQRPGASVAPEAVVSRDFDRGLRFHPLGGARREGEEIARLLGVDALVGDQVLDRTLKGLRSPRVLHLATHGWFLENQRWAPQLADRLGRLGDLQERIMALGAFEHPLMRAGLALAGANTWLEGRPLPVDAEDGLLTAEDIAGMDLSATELVVLSACDTGLGRIESGEGVFGFRRAFALAGARTLVMSLWKVPDQETRRLMVAFYEGLKSGQSREEALRTAGSA
jgi:CHAT domain-containing protein